MKSITLTSKILFLIPLIFFAVSAEAITKKDSLLMTYKLHNGQEYKLAYLMKNSVHTETMGYNIGLDQIMDTYYTASVTEDSPSGYVLATRIDRITGSQKLMDSETFFDSQNPTEPTDQMGKELREALNDLIGKVITMRIDDRGQVLESNYLNLFSQASSGGLVMFDNSQTWYPVYSSKKVIQGSSWEHRVTIGSKGFAFDCIITYTLESFSKKRAYLKVSTVYGPVEGNELNAVKGTATGTIQIDRKTGYPLESSTNQHLELILEQQGMQVMLKVDSDVTMKVIN
ncbi:MAG: DUF6263 family protein [Bacteroidales bacterium]|nr:hypothetical protein [Lentimicrobiaceae bacterium]MDD5695383.1 DUF6263 family protein [Bacteroidales bacterium]